MSGGSSSFDAAKKLDPLAERITMPGKHRYLMPLDDEMRKKVLPLSKPYPKRRKQAMTGAPGTAVV